MAKTCDVQVVDAAALLYEAARGSVPMVYDRGIALGRGPDFRSVDALRAAVIAPGQFATVNRLGIFRLGARPDGQLTAAV